MNQYASNHRVLSPLPNYHGSAVFLAACAALSVFAYLLVSDWIGSNLNLNLTLIAISCALIGYCGRTTWTLYRASDLMDTLDGTVELGRPTRSELLQLSADAQKVRKILDVKSLRSIIQSIQANGDFDLNEDTVTQLRNRAQKGCVTAERSTDAGMLIVPLLAMSMGAWSFMSDSASGTELNAAIMSPLMVGFLSASLLVLFNKQSQHASKLFYNHLQQWLSLRAVKSSERSEEFMELSASVELLKRKVRRHEDLTQQQAETINSLLKYTEEAQDTATPVLLQNQKIIQQATDTRRIVQSTRHDDGQSAQSFPLNASNDEASVSNNGEQLPGSQDRSAAA
ncbi:MAG: hypothetical protein AB8B48_07530 [Pseudomonadales bacterium]